MFEMGQQLSITGSSLWIIFDEAGDSGAVKGKKEQQLTS